jgi:hypothetical protein
MRNQSERVKSLGAPGPIVSMGGANVRTAEKRTISQELKAWLSNVLVPAIVNQYLAEPVGSDNGGMYSTGERVQ